MALPLATSYAPMEAKLVGTLPEGAHWQYEPKWDGFRCLAFKDGAAVDLRSKAGQPFNRYFPELLSAVEALAAPRAVIDGEIVIPVGPVLSFDELLMRIHPAASRVKKLAAEHPALFVAFDLLVDERGKSLTALALAERRARLEAFMATQVPDDSNRLFARAFAIGNGTDTVVIASVTAQGLFKNYVDDIRQQALAVRPQIGGIVVSANHNEASPDTVGIYGARGSGLAVLHVAGSGHCPDARRDAGPGCALGRRPAAAQRDLGAAGQSGARAWRPRRRGGPVRRVAAR